MAANHIQTNSIGVQCQAKCCYEQKELPQAWPIPLVPRINVHRNTCTGVGLFRLKTKKTKRFMIFDPKKGGSFFEPPPPPHLPQNLKKVGFKWGGGSGGVRTKNSLGDAFIGQNNDFTRG